MINKKRRIALRILLVATIQIVLLVLLSFAHSYIISQTNTKEVYNQVSDKEDIIGGVLESGLNLLIGFLSIKQIGTVSAQEVEMYCCPITKNNAICQPIISVDDSNCAEQVVPTSCEEFDDCKYGCCIDDDEGTCSHNSPKKKCLDEEGRWEEGKNCGIAECKKGCCVSAGYEFLTEQACNHQSILDGVNIDFRADINTEHECLSLYSSSEEGACVFQRRCIRTIESECLSDGGTFFVNTFCSNPTLEKDYNYDYTPQASQKCFERNVYWVDSKGNREENILDCVKDGKKCETNNGVGSCMDLSCRDPYFEWKYGRKPKNGESWCIYEGKIDEGRDTVGSEHWWARCDEGEIEGGGYKSCGSYRNMICAEKMIEQDSETFSTAQCVPNMGAVCGTYNPLEEVSGENVVDIQESIDECQENVHCEIRNINIADNFKFKMCVPRYPGGANLSDGADDSLCKFDVTCKVVYEKKNRLDDWDCYSNCGCEKPGFTQQLNQLCYSQGDCGSYINYIGEGTDNSYYTRGRGHKINDDGKETNEESSYSACDTNKAGDNANCQNDRWQNYGGNANPSKDQHALPPQMDEYISSIIGSDFEPGTWEYNSKVIEWLGGITGAIGTIASLAVTFTSLSLGTSLGLTIHSAIMTCGIGEYGAPVMAEVITPAVGLSVGMVMGATAAFGVGLVIGWAYAKALGISGWPATVAMIAGGILGVGLYVLLGVGAINAWNPVGWVLTAIAIVLLIVSWIIGGPDYETRYIDFHCMPWTPPQGGDDCSKCGQDTRTVDGKKIFENVPCTDYKCKSLGTMCELLNPETQYPACVSMVPENIAPEISHLQVLTPGHKFINPAINGIKVATNNGQCIPQGNLVTFVLETDEYAQCKWSFDSTSTNYEGMEGEYPEEGTLFSINHTFSQILPRVDSLKPNQISGSIPNRKGHITMYVRCKDGQNPANFNFNLYTVNICIAERDTEPVTFNRFIPAEDSWLSVGTTEQKIIMWINEPADCRYDTYSGRNYDSMSYNFSCKTGINGGQLWGWPCNTTLPISEGRNRIYIKCKDQPWLNETDPKRNMNNDDKIYTLRLTENPLVINEVTFKHNEEEIRSGGVFEFGGATTSNVEMKVRTSGGSENGVARCTWGVNEEGSRWQMFETYGIIHKQSYTRTEGIHVNYIDCEDSAGNTASAVANFTIYIDNDPPIAIDNYLEDENFIFETNEAANCYYRNDYCNFIDQEANGTHAISSSYDDITHTIPNISPRLNYHIMCWDEWNNHNCTLKVWATEVNNYRAPKIVRAFNSGGTRGELVIITDKESRCYYSADNCSSFEITLEGAEGASGMDNEYTDQHTANWDTNAIYSIKCIDYWGNRNEEECGLVIRASEL